MTLEAPKQNLPSSEAPTLLGLPSLHLHKAVLALIGLIAVAVIAGVSYLALSYYPDEAPPPPTEVEREAAVLFGYPVEGADSKVVGDLLVERFYAIDSDTGERYVADFLKGRIQGIQSLGAENGGPYLALLDLRNLQRDRALYGAFVQAVAKPDGNYLGLRAFSGASDAFRLNYDGRLPEHRASIHGPNGENAYEYLLSQKADGLAQGPKLIHHDGYGYLLSNSDYFPYFRSEFRTGKVMLLSELIIVDATATPQRAKFLQLQAQYSNQQPR